MQPRKLMFYINMLSTGGAERVMSQLANHFSRAGYEVHLVTSFPVDGEYPVDEDVHRYTLEAQELNQSRLMRNISRIAKLRKLCKKIKPHVLISFMQEPNFRAILATAGLPVKTVVSVRNDPNREYGGTLGRFVGKYIMPLADGCVFQTAQAQAWFPQKLQKRSAIILNEVNESFFKTERTGAKHVVSLGRLSAQKNYAMLIRAFGRIAGKHPDQDLLIYGKGDHAEMLEQMIGELGLQERVKLMGVTTKVHDVHSKAGVFVLSSDYEGMPNALMEAMAVGVPSISTDCPCGGPEMLIRDGENGLLVPVGDEEAMAAALDKLLSDPHLAQKMGEQARADAQRYTPEKIFKKWKAFIDQYV